MHQFYQVYPVSRITDEGNAEFLGRGGLGLNKRERGGGGKRRIAPMMSVYGGTTSI